MYLRRMAAAALAAIASVGSSAPHAADWPGSFAAPGYTLRDLRAPSPPVRSAWSRTQDPAYGYGSLPRWVETRQTSYRISTDVFGRRSVEVRQSSRILRHYVPEYYDYGESISWEE